MLLRRLLCTVVVLFFVALSLNATTYAEEEKKDTDTAKTKNKNSDGVKTLSGISIIGNKDAPKSLYIVPWRGSELEMETDLNSSLLNEGFHAVDKDVFIRELGFYESTTAVVTESAGAE